MDTQKFKSLILARQQEIHSLNDLSATGTATVELDQSSVGRLSRMDAIQMQQMNIESERRRNRELIALNAALTRIEDAEFGICIECGDEINPKRLEIDLVTTLCIDCASKQEMR